MSGRPLAASPVKNAPLQLAPSQIALLKQQGGPLVHISVHYHVNFGDCLKIVGSSKELGAWKAPDAPLMTWGPGDVWSLITPLAPGEHEFKVGWWCLGVGGWEGGGGGGCVPACEYACTVSSSAGSAA
jgi:hypothetical protein